MAAPTTQEKTLLIQYAIRDSALGAAIAAEAGESATQPAYYRVFSVAGGAAVPSTSGKTYIVIELDDAKMVQLDEKAFGRTVKDGNLLSSR